MTRQSLLHDMCDPAGGSPQGPERTGAAFGQVQRGAKRHQSDLYAGAQMQHAFGFFDELVNELCALAALGRPRQ